MNRKHNVRRIRLLRDFGCCDLALDAAVGVALPFDRVAVADIVAHVPVLVEREADDLGQRPDLSPIYALLLDI